MRQLNRAIDLRGALSLNVITMIGIGPLVTIPLVIAALGGPLALAGWIGGAVVALCDGLVRAARTSICATSSGRAVWAARSPFSLTGSFYWPRPVCWPAAISGLRTTLLISIPR